MVIRVTSLMRRFSQQGMVCNRLSPLEKRVGGVCVSAVLCSSRRHKSSGGKRGVHINSSTKTYSQLSHQSLKEKRACLNRVRKILEGVSSLDKRVVLKESRRAGNGITASKLASAFSGGGSSKAEVVQSLKDIAEQISSEMKKKKVFPSNKAMSDGGLDKASQEGQQSTSLSLREPAVTFVSLGGEQERWIGTTLSLLDRPDLSISTILEAFNGASDEIRDLFMMLRGSKVIEMIKEAPDDESAGEAFSEYCMLARHIKNPATKELFLQRVLSALKDISQQLIIQNTMKDPYARKVAATRLCERDFNSLDQSFISSLNMDPKQRGELVFQIIAFTPVSFEIGIDLLDAIEDPVTKELAIMSLYNKEDREEGDVPVLLDLLPDKEGAYYQMILDRHPDLKIRF